MQLPSSLAYRLNLARAYAKNSALMLFDELPYALLNSPAGEAFHTMIESWKGHRTILMVTHREDYMQMADISILLRAGESPLAGNPAEVIEAINKSNEVFA
jgi:ABC-type transport system involved in cytochrome bd biosynthesis fused ATPase/permease subunit